MSAADEIEAKIREVEKAPESRLRTLRLQGLRVLLARFRGATEGEGKSDE